MSNKVYEHKLTFSTMNC